MLTQSDIVVACVQQRMSIPPTHQEFEAEARRFLHQAQAKAARLTIFPELTGLMLAPPLISGLKRSFIRRADRGRRPGAGFFSRRLGRLAGLTGDVVGGGFRGSVRRLVQKNSEALREACCETFGRLAREYGTAIVAGSLYLYDAETDTVRNRAYLFDVDGEVLGYQDKLNLSPDEQELAAPGTDLTAFSLQFGRVGALIGRDAMYPELARLLAVQGVELLVGIAATPGVAQAAAIRSALALRAEENQIFAAACFLLGPNHLGLDSGEDYFGQSALLAPISLTPRGDGLLVQAGTHRTEGLVAAGLDLDALHNLWETSRFRPRREMCLGNLGPVLAELYRQGLTIEQAIEQRIAGPLEPLWKPAEPALEPPPAPLEEEGAALPPADEGQ